jgi:hypothetical protein
MRCQCHGRGAVTVNYEDGTPFDLGLCHCRIGQAFRRWFKIGPEGIATKFGVPVERIWPLEDLLDDGDPVSTKSDDRPDFADAGKTKRLTIR